MILQALTQYYEALAKRGEIAAPGWAKAKISYALCLDGQGGLEQVHQYLSQHEERREQRVFFVFPDMLCERLYSFHITSASGFGHGLDMGTFSLSGKWDKRTVRPFVPLIDLCNSHIKDQS